MSQSRYPTIMKWSKPHIGSVLTGNGQKRVLTFLEAIFDRIQGIVGLKKSKKP